MDYNHWSAYGLLGEILPWRTIASLWRRRLTSLDSRREVNFGLRDNDKKLIEFGENKNGASNARRGRLRSCPGAAVRPSRRRGPHGP